MACLIVSFRFLHHEAGKGKASEDRGRKFRCDIAALFSGIVNFFFIKPLGAPQKFSFVLVFIRANVVNERKQNLHLKVRVDQAVRPLPPKALSILVGLVLKLISICNHNL